MIADVGDSPSICCNANWEIPMARHDRNQPAQEPAPTTAEAPAAAAPATATPDDRFKLLTLDDGTQQKRVDFIRAMWKAGKSRSDITKEVNRLIEKAGGKKIKYQIIFSATKGIPGGPPKAEAPAAPAPTAA